MEEDLNHPPWLQALISEFWEESQNLDFLKFFSSVVLILFAQGVPRPLLQWCWIWVPVTLVTLSDGLIDVRLWITHSFYYAKF